MTAHAAAVLRSLDFLANQSHEHADRMRDYMLGVRLIGRGFAEDAVTSRAAAFGADLVARWSEALDADAVDGAAPDELRLRFGDLLNAERLGASPPAAYRAALLRRVREVGFSGFFSFDARTQPPLVAARHANRWDAWQHALIFGWVCERTAGAECGASYFDVLKWLPWLKLEAPLMAQPPAGTHAPADEWRLYAAQLSAVTHVVYTLGDYDQRRLDPTLLPAEFAFLQRALPAALELRMPEAVGEVADCLKAFGLAEASYAPLQAASAFLVGAQNPDGSWGWPVERRLGSIYHTTIVSAWGLRDGAAAPPWAAPPPPPLAFAEIEPVLRLWARWHEAPPPPEEWAGATAAAYARGDAASALPPPRDEAVAPSMEERMRRAMEADPKMADAMRRAQARARGGPPRPVKEEL